MSDPILDFARRHIRPDADAIDIGANQGLYTLPFAKMARKVLAFEPNPDMAQLLRGKLKRFANVEIVEAAASDWIGKATFYLDLRPGAGAAASSLYVLDDLMQANLLRSIEVATTTVDEYAKLVDLRPSFAKIDVEGHEPAVVRGMAHTISRYRPAIVFEFWETWWSKGYKELFESLNPMYRMTKLGTGEDAYAYYTTGSRTGIANIGCVPR